MVHYFYLKEYTRHYQAEITKNPIQNQRRKNKSSTKKKKRKTRLQVQTQNNKQSKKYRNLIIIYPTNNKSSLPSYHKEKKVERNQ